ncbi:hypothetical protein [Pseudomonas sp. AP42]|uniref:hypothetical protein n=1 Tax=Pseudomonas sp. AP42 TaxID=1535632 RepID=UPI00084B6E06|nr:hypothetical protein [Pseudomonas sp. AP42]OEC54804.1 hypothetical protein A7K61_28350 [Pseudomonas sp. AP42]
MTDYTELKRLAEAATPGPWSYDGSYVCPARVEEGTTYVETWRSVADCAQPENTKFIAAANPFSVLAMIVENERLESERAELWRGKRDVEATRDTKSAVIAELKAEIAGLKTGYEAYERVNAQLKAENEALRDDLEQSQYDANAWRNGEESVWIEVFNSEGDDPFISAISGQITVEQLALIQAEILEYREDYFEKGSGLYVFRCGHCQAHYDNVGMTEPAHWETDFESYSPFPWEEEAADLGQGERS